MTYKFYVMDGNSSNTIAWDKFCTEWTVQCREAHLVSSAAEDRLFNIMLGGYNAHYPGNNYLYIEFETAEDATAFVLKFS